MNIFKNKSVLIGIIVFILAFVIYAIYVSSSKKDTGAVTKQAVSGNTITTSGTVTLDGPGKEFVAQLLAIQNITFNLNIFSDSVFKGLQDFSREIQPQEAGRPNPFAPLGDDTREALPSTIDEAVSNIEAPVPAPSRPKSTKKK